MRQSILNEFSRIRRKVFQDRPLCAYCGRPADELHHIIPRHMGGDNRPQNLIPLCQECHAKAHDKTYTHIGNKGRKRAEIPQSFDEIASEYLGGSYSLKEICELLNMSKSTFYDRLSEYRERTGDIRDHRKEKLKSGKLYEKTVKPKKQKKLTDKECIASIQEYNRKHYGRSL